VGSEAAEPRGGATPTCAAVVFPGRGRSLSRLVGEEGVVRGAERVGMRLWALLLGCSQLLLLGRGARLGKARGTALPPRLSRPGRTGPPTGVFQAAFALTG
jgi:hypothetical protein